MEPRRSGEKPRGAVSHPAGMGTGPSSVFGDGAFWCCVQNGLTAVRRQLKLRKEQGFSCQHAVARLGNHVPGSESLAIPSSAELVRNPPAPSVDKLWSSYQL